MTFKNKDMGGGQSGPDPRKEIKKPKFIKSVDDAVWRDMRKRAIDLDLTMGQYIEMIHDFYVHYTWEK